MNRLTLRHLTIDTGHVRESGPEEVLPGTLEHLAPLLTLALERGGLVDLSQGWHCRAREQDGALWCRLHHADQAASEPLVSFQVLPPAGGWVALTLSLDALEAECLAGNLPPAAVLALDDVQRCLAWTWILRVRLRADRPDVRRALADFDATALADCLAGYVRAWRAGPGLDTMPRSRAEILEARNPPPVPLVYRIIRQAPSFRLVRTGSGVSLVIGGKVHRLPTESGPDPGAWRGRREGDR